MSNMKQRAAMIVMALMAMAPAAKAQTTPFNNSAASPCPEVLIEQKYDHVNNPRYRAAGWDTAVTCANRTLELVAEPYIPVQYFNGTYLVEQVPYNPPDPTFSMGTRMPIGIDDVFADNFTNIPYPFYFFGQRKNQFRIGANGLVTFCSPSDFGSGNSCPWAFSSNNQLPWNGTSQHTDPFNQARMRDAIYGVMEDTHPGHFVGSETNRIDGIYYGIQDEFPCRKIICSWKEAPNFGDYSHKGTYQIVCYEGSNIIEVHVKQRRCCPTTSDAMIGIQNATAQPQQPSTTPGDPNYFVQAGSPAAFWPSGRNVFTTNIDTISYRFTPQGMTARNCIWFRLLPNGDSITLTTNPLDTNGYYLAMGHDPDHPTLTKAIVSPNMTSKYVCKLSFMNANEDWYHLFDTLTVGMDTVNTLQLTANQAGNNTAYTQTFNICQGGNTELGLHYTNIQQPANITWTIKRILNGQMEDLPEGMVVMSDNDTAFTLLPDPNFAQLPQNKIDSIYVRAVVDFVSGCTNYDTITVRTFPNFDTIEPHGICDGETFHWEANGQNYTKTTTEPTVHKQSEAGCDSVIHLHLTVFDVSHTPHDTVDCKPIRWIDGKLYTESNNTATYDTVNIYGCDSIVHLNFTLAPLTAKLKSSLSYFDYDHIDVELTDISTGGSSRVWHFPTGTDQTSPVAYYSIPVNMDSADIRLVAQSPYGCVDSTHIVIPFRRETFWMPNAFTPDNPAGNSTFGSVSTKTVQQEMMVYNRFGELVFRCSGVDCQWDGRNMDGEPCPQGAYAYIIRYTNEFEPQTTKVVKGSVTLIR